MFQIDNTKTGVKAMLQGFKAESLQEKIDACKEGSCGCSCDPQMMQKISNIEVKNEKNGVSITITGDVDAETLAPMMQECLL